MEAATGASELTVGQLASMSRLTIRALRHYDEIALLRPARIDPNNGYRYYQPSQLETASLIAVLRELDIDVPTVRQILDGTRALNDVIEAEEARRKRELRRAETSLSVLQSLADDIRRDRPQIREIASYPLAACSLRVTAAAEIDALTDAFETLFATFGATEIEHGDDGVCIIHRSSRDAIDVEIGVPVQDPTASLPDGYRITMIEAGTVATAVHDGPLESLPLGHARLNTWILELGRRPSGSPRETFLGALTDRRTRIEIPLER